MSAKTYKDFDSKSIVNRVACATHEGRSVVASEIFLVMAELGVTDTSGQNYRLDKADIRAPIVLLLDGNYVPVTDVAMARDADGDAIIELQCSGLQVDRNQQPEHIEVTTRMEGFTRNELTDKALREALAEEIEKQRERPEIRDADINPNDVERLLRAELYASEKMNKRAETDLKSAASALEMREKQIEQLKTLLQGAMDLYCHERRTATDRAIGDIQDKMDAINDGDL